MTPFSYSRADNAADAIRLGGGAGAKFLGGGTNLVDLMRETIERPSALIDVTGLDDGIVDTNEGGLKIGAAVRNSALAADRRVRSNFPDADPRDRRRRQRADPQHGHRRRQSASAHALHLFLRRCRLGLQQAFARAGLRRASGLPPLSRHPRRVGAVYRDPSIGHGSRAGRARRGGASGGKRWRAIDRAHRSPPPAGRATRHRDGTQARRTDHRDRTAAAGAGAQLDLSQGPRPGELCLRVDLRCRRARGEGRSCHRSSGSRSAVSRTNRGARRRPKRR